MLSDPYLICSRCEEDNYHIEKEDGQFPEYWECDHCGYGNHKEPHDADWDETPF